MLEINKIYNDERKGGGGHLRYYISGAITNNPNYKSDFERAEMWLKLQGYEVINPCKVPYQLSHAEFMKIDLALLELCDGIYMLSNWKQSNGAKTELAVAKALGKKVKFESKQWAIRPKE